MPSTSLTTLRAWPLLFVAAACRGGLQPLPPPVAPARVNTPGTAPATAPTNRGAPHPDDHNTLVTRALAIPVQGVTADRLRDTYEAARGDRMHAALDIMAPRGTPVVAADGGLVWKVRSNPLGGLTIYILDADERYVYYYAHLDRYADGLKEGQQVLKGDVVGYVGTTGNAPPNAPHLHFQLMKYRGDGRWWDGEPINPYPYLTRATESR